MIYLTVYLPFDGLETPYLQEKFVSEEIGCIVSIRNHETLFHISHLCYCEVPSSINKDALEIPVGRSRYVNQMAGPKGKRC